jgi:hypothetical protein
MSLVAVQGVGAEVPPPPNAPGAVILENGTIAWTYAGRVVFRGEISTESARYTAKIVSQEKDGRVDANIVSQEKDGRIDQLLVLTTQRWEDSIDIRGRILAGPESFPCEADPREQGMRIVRHVHGLSRSLLNRGVYDRTQDWVLSVDHNPRVKIEPLSSGPEGREYGIAVQGREIIIRFRPRFYQFHRGLSYYEPWTYRVWPKPVVGWCSWFAYFADITEEDVTRTTDIVAEVLAPYGYEYIQIDDGYQRGEGLPELWLNTNARFPNGLSYLAGYIKNRGLKPGIWTNMAFNQEEYARRNKDYFVLTPEGKVARGNWVNISVDGSNPEAVDTLVRPVYKGLRDQGWQYFKVDALRHLRYEGYNSRPEYFEDKGVDRGEAFRDLVKAIREEIGREHFMMGCWGIRPELIGIIDGCRIGTDGYSFAGLSQYNSFNNVVWLNDPDHIELSPEEAYRSTMATSLTGSLFMLTDKPEVYRTERADPAKRAAPVLFTLPGQIFDVDPSRSQNLHRVDVEVTGSGPRVFDAGRDPKVHLFLLEIDKPFENWMLLGRTGDDFEFIPFTELGLVQDAEYFVFEFWSKRLLGSFSGGFDPGDIDPRFNCQLFCIRRRLSRPQILATDRHITCGGYDLEEVTWRDGVLSGRSRMIAGETQVLYVSEPQGFVLARASCGAQAEIIGSEKSESLRRIHIRAEVSGSVDWDLRY